MFGNKMTIENALSKNLQELRDSDKAEGCERIYIHGEKSNESRIRVMQEGLSLNEKTYDEMKIIGTFTGAEKYLPEYLD